MRSFQVIIGVFMGAYIHLYVQVANTFRGSSSQNGTCLVVSFWSGLTWLYSTIGE